MKIVFLIISAILLTGSVNIVFGTPQRPDILIYEGKEYPIYNEPLEIFFKAHPERRPKFCGGMSSLWRGYVAHIEVVEKELILRDIRIHTVNPKDPACLQESKILEVVPDGRNFKLDWFSGELLAAYGEHIGGGNFYDVWKIYEKYSLFRVDKGKLTSVSHYTNSEYQEYLKHIPKN